MLCCVTAAVLGQSLPRRPGMKSLGSSRQLAAQCHDTVQEEHCEDSPSAAEGRVYFDVGDDISYVVVSLSALFGYSFLELYQILSPQVLKSGHFSKFPPSPAPAKFLAGFGRFQCSCSTFNITIKLTQLFCVGHAVVLCGF